MMIHEISSTCIIVWFCSSASVQTWRKSDIMNAFFSFPKRALTLCLLSWKSYQHSHSLLRSARHFVSQITSHRVHIITESYDSKRLCEDIAVPTCMLSLDLASCKQQNSKGTHTCHYNTHLPQGKTRLVKNLSCSHNIRKRNNRGKHIFWGSTTDTIEDMSKLFACDWISISSATHINITCMFLPSLFLYTNSITKICLILFKTGIGQILLGKFTKILKEKRKTPTNIESCNALKKWNK